MSRELQEKYKIRKGDKVLHISMMGSPYIRTLTVDDVDVNVDGDIIVRVREETGYFLLHEIYTKEKILNYFRK